MDEGNAAFRLSRMLIENMAQDVNDHLPVTTEISVLCRINTLSQLWKRNALLLLSLHLKGASLQLTMGILFTSFYILFEGFFLLLACVYLHFGI